MPVKGKEKFPGEFTEGVPRLLGIKDAASFLGLTPYALRKRIWDGDLPFVRFPGCRKQYIDARDLERVISENKIERY